MKTFETVEEQESIRAAVRRAYASRAGGGGCCGPTASDHEEAALRMGYSPEEVAAVPEGANLGLGCGAPLEGADLQPGETVLDLGSGAGFDAFLAARRVGPRGRVIGVDMTAEMVAKARENAARAGVENVEFRQGLIEDLPVADEEIDVLISNCVINLSPDKGAVFREAFRVLRPGGRLAVSDIVLTAPLPSAVAESMAAYVGCVAGASLLEDYLRLMEEAGFGDVRVADSRPAAESLPADDPIVRAVAEGAGVSPGELAPQLERLASQVLSAKITARKP